MRACRSDRPHRRKTGQGEPETIRPTISAAVGTGTKTLVRYWITSVKHPIDLSQASCAGGAPTSSIRGDPFTRERLMHIGNGRARSTLRPVSVRSGGGRELKETLPLPIVKLVF